MIHHDTVREFGTELARNRLERDRADPNRYFLTRTPGPRHPTGRLPYSDLPPSAGPDGLCLLVPGRPSHRFGEESTSLTYELSGSTQLSTLLTAVANAAESATSKTVVQQCEVALNGVVDALHLFSELTRSPAGGSIVRCGRSPFVDLRARLETPRPGAPSSSRRFSSMMTSLPTWEWTAENSDRCAQPEPRCGAEVHVGFASTGVIYLSESTRRVELLVGEWIAPGTREMDIAFLIGEMYEMALRTATYISDTAALPYLHLIRHVADRAKVWNGGSEWDAAMIADDAMLRIVLHAADFVEYFGWDDDVTTMVGWFDEMPRHRDRLVALVE